MKDERTTATGETVAEEMWSEIYMAMCEISSRAYTLSFALENKALFKPIGLEVPILEYLTEIGLHTTEIENELLDMAELKIMKAEGESNVKL